MTTKFSFAAMVIAAGLMFASGPSIANTSVAVGSLKTVAAAQGTTVQKVGYWNRCRWGIGGYHKWVPGVGRVQCTARKCWRNSWGIRRCRWY
ncbi:hypothetical protein RLW55_04715 [Hyphomicrobium sp. B1]|uniref:hypothetical protein n=1 Tax=unclassified Hyphomicrobium TaxID=2619925 RepID=UPI00391DA5CB